MAYIGSTPTTQNFIAGTDQFTGNGSSTNFTLSRFVNSTNDIEVVIANVVQNPTSYSVNGNTLTISPAVGNGVAFYVRYLSTTTQAIAPMQRSVGIAELSASGTPNSGTFLRGDNVWAIVEGVPAGTVIYYAATSAPTGYLKANGAAVSRTVFSGLFSAIGTTFGAGNGSTTFNLPDLRGEFLRGWDDGRGVDSGRGFGSFQNHEFLTHKHYQGAGEEFPTLGFFASTTWRNGSTASNTGRLAWTSTAYTTSDAATGGAETRPRNIALLACIKF